MQLLESTLDSMQVRVRELEEQCRSQTERFSLLAQELQAFRLHPGPLDLLTSALGCPNLGDRPPPPCCCSTPQPCRGTGPKDDLPPGSPGRCTPKSSEPAPVHTAGAPRRTAKKTESLSNSSRSESVHNSPKSCPTPEVDTASEVEELEADNVSLIPAVPEGSQGGARIQVFLARYSYNPFEGPNENPEAELPLTAGEYIYIYGNMDEDGFFEGELMDGRRGLVPSNFVERVSDDDLLTSLPLELADLSHSSGPELSFLSGVGGGGSSSGGQSSESRIQSRPEDDAAGDALSLSPLPEGLGEPPAVPYPCHLAVVKQLAHSVVLAWEPPSERVELQGYHVCVNGALVQALGPGAPPKALLENLDLQAGPLHVSVQALTSQGSSDPLRCCLAVGARAGVVPSQLRVHRLTATSAEITWVPGNSNLTHAIYLNGEECPPARPSTYWATFCHLRPGTLYQARVEAQLPPRGCWEAGWERPEQRAATLQFTTLLAGPPDAPLDVQIEPGPSPGILTISWLPVTIDAVGTSNGVRVTGYAIYADGQKLMEVASPTAGSVLVEVSQLQLLHACHQVAVRTMSPHGESADSVLAPVGPALAAACLPAKLTCTSPRPSLETRASLVPASPGPGDPSSPIQHLEIPGTRAPPGAPSDNLPKETREESLEEQPAPSSQGLVRPPVPGISEDRREHELMVAERLPGPAAASMAEEAEWLEGEACPAPCSTQREACAEPCHGGESGSEQRPRVEREDATELGSCQVNAPKDQGRSPELSDIQEEDEEEEPGSRTGSSRKQVAGSSLGEEGTKPQPDPSCETDSDEEVLEQILELPLQQFCSKKLFSIPEEEEEDEEEEDQEDGEKPGTGSSRDPGLPEPMAAAEGSGGSTHGPGPGSLSPEPCGAGDCLEDVPGAVGGSSRRRSSGSPEKPNRRRAPDPREHCSRLLSNGGPQAPGRQGSARERGGPPLTEAGGRGRPAPARTCSRGRAPESSLASCLSPKCLEISIEYDSEDEQEAGGRGLGTSSSGSVGDEEAWASVPVGRPRAALKASSGPSPSPRLPAWEKGEPERRGRSATGRAKEPPSRAAETGEPRGQDSSGHRGPPQRGGRATRLSAQELAPPRSPPEAALAHRNLPVRLFVALFDYDPMSMSPNPDAGEEELPFREGQILKVFGDKDADGFYWGEGGGRMGYIPCNMVAEVAVDSSQGRRQLLQRAFLSPEVLVEVSESGSCPLGYSAAHTSGPPPKPRRSKKVEAPGPAQPSADAPPPTSACLKAPHPMVAAFDYNPRESSPNMDVEAELPFRAGDIITVFGAMDDDGFYYGELNGQRGLVPSNFLEAPGPEDREPRSPQSEGQDWSSTKQGHPMPQGCPCASDPGSNPRAQGTREKVRGLFSKGKQLLLKLGSGTKE